MPEPPTTLAALRPPPGSDEDPVHRRTIAMEVFQRGDYFAVIGTLHDERPWAGGALGPRDLHRMELGVVVRRADMTIVDAAADMQTLPARRVHRHRAELSTNSSACRSPAGYSNAVQQRFGRERGCSHLEFLARAIGPVVIQGLTSSGAWEVEKGSGEHPMREGGFGFLTNTCHVWTEDGAGAQKIDAGWRPGLLGYPAPSAVEVRRAWRDGDADGGGAPRARPGSAADVVDGEDDEVEGRPQRSASGARGRSVAGAPARSTAVPVCAVRRGRRALRVGVTGAGDQSAVTMRVMTRRGRAHADARHPAQPLPQLPRGGGVERAQVLAADRRRQPGELGCEGGAQALA